MKKLKIVLVTIFACFAAMQLAQAEEYTIEGNHASVMWIADHFGYSHPSGKFTNIEGTITFDEKHPEKSMVDVIVKTESLTTGLFKFDQHLKSADFFNVERFEAAKFVSTKITVTGKRTAKISGDLTIVGVTKSVVLNAKFNKSGISMITQKPTIGFSATGSINRSDFGLNYGLPGVADKVNLVIEVEANRAI
ncbi:MAG: YceI family protein [Pseudomonadota bacterium]